MALTLLVLFHLSCLLLLLRFSAPLFLFSFPGPAALLLLCLCCSFCLSTVPPSSYFPHRSLLPAPLNMDFSSPVPPTAPWLSPLLLLFGSLHSHSYSPGSLLLILCVSPVLLLSPWVSHLLRSPYLKSTPLSELIFFCTYMYVVVGSSDRSCVRKPDDGLKKGTSDFKDVNL